MRIETVRHDLRDGDGVELRPRRGIAGLSLAGLASMATTSLYQTGIVRHLPDPPIAGFDSDKVNASKTAYKLGAPDGTLAAVSFALNLPIAAFGAGNRSEKRPWVPLLAAGKAAIDAAVASWYFYQMPAKEKAWCGYCITAAVADLGIFLLSLPEARRALNVLRKQ